MIVKNLVFSFYTFKGFMENEAIRLHLKCLKRYSHIFNNALFVISIKDTSDIGTIKETEKAIIDCGFRHIKFTVSQNDYYCEGKAFKEEIIDKIDSFEGLTFFGHTKGVTNVENPKMGKVSILKWIAGMYYLNLNFIDEVERMLIKEFTCAMYGAYKVIDKGIENANNRWYAGTFYWINTNRLSNNMRQRGRKFPKLHDRGYAEFITGEVDMLASHGDAYLFPFEYNNAGFLTDFLLLNDSGEIEKYHAYEKEVGV